MGKFKRDADSSDDDESENDTDLEIAARDRLEIINKDELSTQENKIYKTKTIIKLLASLKEKYCKTKNKKLKVDPMEDLTIVNEKSIELPDLEINSQIKRELAFYNLAHENVKAKLEGVGVKNEKLFPPFDYFAEMLKSDKQVQSIKNRLVKHQVKIDSFQERKKRKENKKFAKSIEAYKRKEKASNKKKNIDAIQKWKDELKTKGNAELDNFLPKTRKERQKNLIKEFKDKKQKNRMNLNKKRGGKSKRPSKLQRKTIRKRK